MTSTHTVRAPIWTRMLPSPAERWIAVSVILAWGAILALEVRLWSQPLETVSLMHGSHTMHIEATGGDYPSTATWLAIWVLMVVAMMWPLTLQMAGSISRASYHDWRAICVAVSLLVFTALWVAAGLALVSGVRMASVPDHSRWWQIGWLVTAVAVMTALWPARRARVLWRCATFGPLAPSGWRGIVSSARVGAISWRRCAQLCGPVMAAMVVGHSIVVMVFVSASAWWEFAHARSWRDPVPVVLVGVAAGYLTIALLFAEGSA